MEAQSLPGAVPRPNVAPLIPIAAVTSEVASSVPSQYRSQVASLHGTAGGSSDLPAGFVPRGHHTDTGGEKNVSRSPESLPQIPGSLQLAPIKPQDTFQASNRPQLPPIGSAGDLDLSSVSTFSPLSGLVPWDGLGQSQGLSGVQSQEWAGRTGQKRCIEWEEVSHAGGGDQTEAKRRRQSVQLEAPDWLPPGWTVVARTREAGRSAGTTDKYYLAPDQKMYRSRVEVQHFLSKGERMPRPLRGHADVANGTADLAHHPSPSLPLLTMAGEEAAVPRSPPGESPMAASGTADGRVTGGSPRSDPGIHHHHHNGLVQQVKAAAAEDSQKLPPPNVADGRGRGGLEGGEKSAALAPRVGGGGGGGSRAVESTPAWAHHWKADPPLVPFLSPMRGVSQGGGGGRLIAPHPPSSRHLQTGVPNGGVGGGLGRYTDSIMESLRHQLCWLDEGGRGQGGVGGQHPGRSQPVQTGAGSGGSLGMGVGWTPGIGNNHIMSNGGGGGWGSPNMGRGLGGGAESWSMQGGVDMRRNTAFVPDGASLRGNTTSPPSRLVRQYSNQVYTQMESPSGYRFAFPGNSQPSMGQIQYTDSPVMWDPRLYFPPSPPATNQGTVRRYQVLPGGNGGAQFMNAVNHLEYSGGQAAFAVGEGGRSGWRGRGRRGMGRVAGGQGAGGGERRFVSKADGVNVKTAGMQGGMPPGGGVFGTNSVPPGSSMMQDLAVELAFRDLKRFEERAAQSQTAFCFPQVDPRSDLLEGGGEVGTLGGWKKVHTEGGYPSPTPHPVLLGGGRRGRGRGGRGARGGGGAGRGNERVEKAEGGVESEAQPGRRMMRQDSMEGGHLSLSEVKEKVEVLGRGVCHRALLALLVEVRKSPGNLPIATMEALVAEGVKQLAVGSDVGATAGVEAARGAAGCGMQREEANVECSREGGEGAGREGGGGGNQDDREVTPGSRDGAPGIEKIQTEEVVEEVPGGAMLDGADVEGEVEEEFEFEWGEGEGEDQEEWERKRREAESQWEDVEGRGKDITAGMDITAGTDVTVETDVTVGTDVTAGMDNGWSVAPKRL